LERIVNKLQLALDKLDVKRRELAGIFEAAGPDLNMTDEQAADVKQRNTELDELGKEVAQLREVTDIEAKNRRAMEENERIVPPVPHAGGASDAPSPTARKSIGQLFVESAAYKDAMARKQRSFTVDIDHEVKTLVSESGTGFAPQAIRTGMVVDSPQQQPRIVDVIPATTTTQVAVVFMQETTYTNAAAEVAEGGAYGEGALAYTQATSPVEKIGVFLPVTDEQLADVPGMEGRLNNRLGLMIRQRIDLQVVAGNGSSPNLLGIVNTSGVLTQAKGTDPNVDAVLKGITKVRNVGFAEPDVILMNPTDWQNIRLLRTADGVYLFGFPGDPGVARLWGLPIVESTYLPLGTAIPGDYRGYTELSYKAGLELDVSNSHNDFFAKGQLAIRAQIRAAFVVYRASALCTVTGL
jgi:HK97 family phage major capsid protein